MWMLAVASVPPVYVTSQLDEGILCIFSTGKARLWWDILFLYWKETGLVFQSSKVPSRSDSLMSCCSNFFDNPHWDACICLWQTTRDLLFYGAKHLSCTFVSILCAYRFLSWAVFSFLHTECAGMLQMVDTITGRVISSMVIVLALKVHCDTYLFPGFTPRTRSCSGLLSLLYSTAPGSD